LPTTIYSVIAAVVCFREVARPELAKAQVAKALAIKAGTRSSEWNVLRLIKAACR
jgi:hypothetical protein